MKKILIASLAALALAGCYRADKDVLMTLTTDGLEMTIQPKSRFEGVYSTDSDTIVLGNTVCEMAAYTLASHDSLTLNYIDVDKQAWLPSYVFTVYRTDGRQGWDDLPDMAREMERRGLIRTDTVYRPLRLLTMVDTARWVAYGDTVPLVVNTMDLVARLQMGGVAVKADPGLVDTAWIIGPLGRLDTAAFKREMAECGLDLVPDPQGRMMRVITFNRKKGKV